MVNDQHNGFNRISDSDRRTLRGGGMMVLTNGHHLSSTTDFTRQQARSPSTPANLPNPLCFTPPNGRDCTKEGRSLGELGCNRNKKASMMQFEALTKFEVSPNKLVKGADKGIHKLLPMEDFSLFFGFFIILYDPR